MGEQRRSVVRPYRPLHTIATECSDISDRRWAAGITSRWCGMSSAIAGGSLTMIAQRILIRGIYGIRIGCRTSRRI